ncbi:MULTISPECIES: TetR/AcrR family transcriptional regulator [Microbacterium]|uniref:DNA-binding transcriptional regulator, AcrR family n=1 Tax=Microbacterium saccharophilum TaxID=1213358 RepID=A0A7Z7CZH4_9MICO|nr:MULTISPECIES: TetR/AcrR family transcriptional regulator [Microbacterium]SFI73471.1 DNA-binding transcriptional regulator, AcrR family [Microbacterium saccharophilum]
MVDEQSERSTSRGPGRPIEADPDAIALTALRLFAEHGADGITMTKIAQACGISRRSLFRWFPSKAALVWGGTVEADERFEAAYAARPAEGTPLAELVKAAYVSAIAPLGATADVTRLRLQLIDANPNVYAWGADARRRMSRHIAEHIAHSERVSPDGLRAITLAAAWTAAAYTALVWWADHGGDRSPADVLDEALTGLGLG